MTSKKLEFQLKVDSSDFDRAIEKIQRQLKEAYRPADMMLSQRQTAQRLEGMGLGGGLSKPAMEAIVKSINTARTEMGKVLKEQQKLQEESLKTLHAHVSLEKQLTAEKEKSKKGSTEELELLRRIEAVKKNIHNEEIQHKAREKTIMETAAGMQNMGPQDKLERLAMNFRGGGIKGGLKEGAIMGSEAWQGLGMTKQAGILLSAITVGFAKIGDTVREISQVPLQVSQAQGAAAGGLFGTPLQSIYSGQTPEDLLFARETQAAKDKAILAEEGRRFSDKMHIPIALGKALIGMGGTDVDYLKSFVPGEYGAQYKSKYESDQAQQTQEQILRDRESEKLRDPLRMYAAQDFQAKSMANLNFQRATGLDYNTFHGAGGFREQVAGAGFLDTMGMEASQGILGAGGSTRAAGAGGSILALQAQRAYGLTNAPQTLGKVSGLMGDTESSRQTFTQMIAEGQRQGLDSSQYRSEFRRFMDIQSSAIDQSGTRSQADITDILQRLGGFLGGDKTIRGMNAGQSAYQAYSGAVSATQGPQGAMRAGAMLSDPMLSQMAGPDLANLYGVDLQHLTTDSPVVKSLFNKYKGKIKGLTKEGLVSRAISAGGKSFFQRPQGDALIKRQQTLNKQLSHAKDPEQRKVIQKQLEDVIDATASEIHLQTGIQDPVELRQMARGIGGTGNQRARIEKEMATAQQKLEDKGAGGTLEDKQVQSLAESSKLMIHTMQRLHDTFVISTSAAATYTQELERQANEYGKLGSDRERAAYLKNPDHKTIQAFMNSHQPKDQKQAQ